MIFKRTFSLVLAFTVILMFVFVAVSFDLNIGISGPALAQDPLIDTDSDGMNDTWETANFGDLSESGSGDFDNDTHSNLEEFEAGTDPTDATDPPEEESDDNTTIIIVLAVIGGLVVLGIIGFVIYYMMSGGGEGEPGGLPDDMGGEPGGGGGDFLDEGLEMDEDEDEFEDEEGEGIPGMGGMPGEEMEEEEEYEEGEVEEAEEGEEEEPGEEGAEELPSKDDEEPKGDAPVEVAVDGEPSLQEKIAFVKEKFAKGEITQEQFEMVILKLQEEDQTKKEVGAAPKKKDKKPKTVPMPEKKAKKSTGYECSRCGGLMDDLKKKCPGCGANFVDSQAMCPVCESKVPIDASECRKCGSLFEE